MPRSLLVTLRLVAATLVTSAGALRVASLWLRELNQAAVLSLLLGAVYLLIGIGLFGRSRFALFMGMLVPAATSVLAVSYFTMAGLHPVQWAGLCADAVAVACCVCVLWQVRKEPSV